MEIFPTDYLLYGPPHGGKTSWAVSAMWDWVKKEKLRNGRLIQIGREKNPYLHIPDEFLQTGSGQSLAVKSPLLDADAKSASEYDQWLFTLDNLTKALVRDANQKKADRPEVVVLDGWTEFDLLYENTEARQRMDAMARFGSLLSETFTLLQRLDPQLLEVAFVSTARVGEKRKAKVNRRGEEFVPGDPAFVVNDYYPSYRGQMRYELPHYFSNVYYMQEEVRKVNSGPYEGRELPVHALTVLKGDSDQQHFAIKNQSEHEWLDAGYPTVLYNSSFDTVNERFIELRDEYSSKGVANIIRHEDVA